MLKKIIFSLLAGIMLTVPVVAVAQGNYGLEETAGRLGYQTGEKADLYARAGQVVSVGLSVFGIVFFAITLYGGIRWLTSRGNEDLVGRAKTALEAGIIGLVVIAGAYALSSFVLGRLGSGGNAGTGSTEYTCSAIDLDTGEETETTISAVSYDEADVRCQSMCQPDDSDTRNFSSCSLINP